MPAERDIGAVRIEPWGSENMGSVYRHALCLVDGGRIAMVDIGIGFEVDRDTPAVVEPHFEPVARRLFDRAKRAVLHAQFTLVAQEENAIALGKLAEAALGPHAHFRSEEQTSELQ